ncbi:MAG: phosphate-starvation-inducible PsiE family protein [Desulfurococcales archaeon]|nr:phosphate-starvation-inducible PsiE family protein [Desulfurococcales archaeon]
MQEWRGRRGVALSLDIAMEILEVMLAIVLIITVALQVGHLFVDVIKIEVEGAPQKEDILHILDLTLLLVLAVDILRTLAVAVRRRLLPVRIVVEAAMVAILRELIAVEIRHLDWKMILSLGVTFVLLAGAWAAIGVLQKRGLLEATAAEAEEG